MKLIESSFEIVPQEYNIDGILKQIELCGRVSYKSEDKITENSAKDFVEKRIVDGHTAILEQGTVYLEFPPVRYADHMGVQEGNVELCINSLVLFYVNNFYSRVVIFNNTGYVTTNYRVLFENDRLSDLDYCCNPSDSHNKRVTVKFTTSRGITHELVRHRAFSFMQESTRFCNYSKGKFGSELTFIKPSWWDDTNIRPGVKEAYKSALDFAQFYYLMLTTDGDLKAQQARGILPNDLKADIYMTGFISDWKEFFKLRTAPSAHPDMRALAIPLEEEMKKLYPEDFK